ncbi:MAG: hypothetical protein A3B68_07445 [Candidatus Melainabacteria bacterium RIFCSPHIGHO2_02_FULL_34_12]|nr:MAG: hypothetical protein A3B68_07445 [Candidatus Melainabacteria bacterium RIFCSPHIGHO2_02_FULL_34_12]
MTGLVSQKTLPQIYGFNYVQPQKLKQQFQLVPLDEIEDAVFSPLLKTGANDKENHCLSCRGKSKAGLPVSSDFGEIKSPYELIYARLEGLQYYNRY